MPSTCLYLELFFKVEKKEKHQLAEGFEPVPLGYIVLCSTFKPTTTSTEDILDNRVLGQNLDHSWQNQSQV